MDPLRLYVGNLPYAAQPREVEELFVRNGIPMYVDFDTRHKSPN